MQLIRLLQEKGQAFHVIMLLFTTLLIVGTVSAVSANINFHMTIFRHFPTNKHSKANQCF